VLLRPGKVQWFEKEILIRVLSSQEVNLSVPVEQFPNTHFLSGQKFTSITVPYELLSSPLRVALDVYRSQAGKVAPPPCTTDFQINVGNSLKAVLSPYLPERIPGIEAAAEMAATSVRTLQRRLQKSGLSYSDLIGELRFETAARLLRETDATALEIALEVGYEDPSHFSRAFKRMASISPREYRRRQRIIGELNGGKELAIINKALTI